MGIKGLRKFIKDKFPNVIKDFDMTKLYGKKIAFDCATPMYKCKIVNPDHWISSVLNIYLFFKKYNIHPITCFDGKTPILKLTESIKRQSSKLKNEKKIDTLIIDLYDYESSGKISELLETTINKLIANNNDTIKRMVKKSTNEKVNEDDIANPKKIKLIEDYITLLTNRNESITNKDKHMIRKFLRLLGFHFIKCPFEAETIACFLSKNDKVDAVLSEDSDTLAYGCKLSLFDLDTKAGQCKSIKYSRLLKEMELSSSQFTDFCILCGTDYNSNITGVGPVNAYKLIKEYGSIENIKHDTSHINLVDIRKLFQFEELNDKNEKLYLIDNYKSKYNNSNIDKDKLFGTFMKYGINVNTSKIEELWEPIKIELLNEVTTEISNKTTNEVTTEVSTIE